MRLADKGSSPSKRPDANGALRQILLLSTAGIIADRLRTAIMLGDLGPGEQLGEVELAEQFGISRGPLREAIQRLVQEGLLKSVKNHGVFVITLSEEDVQDIYVVRGAVEKAAADLILARDPSRAASRLDEILADMRGAAARSDSTALSEADQRFHEVLVEESGSKRLQRMASTVLVESRMCMTALETRYSDGDTTVREHADIVSAIRTGARDQVIRELDAHMHQAVVLLTR